MSPLPPESRRTLYGPGWRRLSAKIRVERAGNRCEQRRGGEPDGARCNAPHGTAIVRDPADPFEWCLAAAARDFGWRGRITSVRLATAHLDHDATNNAYHLTDPFAPTNNLRVMCQRCHLEHDRRDNLQRRRRGIDRKTGQERLFDDD